jgi:hypothetical protein
MHFAPAVVKLLDKLQFVAGRKIFLDLIGFLRYNALE